MTRGLRPAAACSLASLSDEDDELEESDDKDDAGVPHALVDGGADPNKELIEELDEEESDGARTGRPISMTWLT